MRCPKPDSEFQAGKTFADERNRDMDWRIVVSTFGVIFLAEMGDKTQLAAMTLAAQSQKPWSVLIGAAVGLVVVSAIGVTAGALLTDVLPVAWIKRASAVAFIAVGVLMLLGKL